jgi:hypothetical protein
MSKKNTPAARALPDSPVVLQQAYGYPATTDSDQKPDGDSDRPERRGVLQALMATI